MLLIYFALWSIVDSNEVDPCTIDRVGTLHGNLRIPKLMLISFSIMKKPND
jgi:hypothetical protein